MAIGARGRGTGGARARTLERLADLAYDASSYLRHSPSRAVRASAALLLAASLAACSPMQVAQTVLEGGSPAEEVVTAEPLSQEMRNGLPSQPGRYVLHTDSLRRDQRGVYHFDWRQTEDPPDKRNQATASAVKMQEANENALEIAQDGNPVLHLTKDTPINLVEAGAAASGSTGGGGSGMTTWLPFLLMANTFGRPAYYDPPPTIQRDTRIEGSRQSLTLPPPAERVTGVRGAVSGRAGGAGTGTAVTDRLGGKSGVTGSSSGVSAPKSGGFSSGIGSGSSSGSS